MTQPLVATEDKELFYPKTAVALATSILVGVIASLYTSWQLSILVALVSLSVGLYLIALQTLATALALAASSYRHSVLMEHRDREAREELMRGVQQ